MSLQPNPFDSKFDTVAIRLPRIDTLVPKFGGTQPVVLFASHSSTPLDSPVGIGQHHRRDKEVGGIFESFSGFGKDNKGNFGRLPESYPINRVIFLVDCSNSMDWSLHSGSAVKKIDFVKEQVGLLARDYFPERTNVSLISFNAEHHVENTSFKGGTPTSKLKRAVQRLELGPGTNFNPPLEAARQIILDDHLTLSQSQVETSGVPRSVIVFLTDGQDRIRKGEDLPAATFTQLRDLNTTSFVLGIGQDYQMRRIVELAGHAGASSWSHLPMENGSLDPFSVQLPLMLEQVMRCENFFEFSAQGDFSRFSCVSPTLRFASRYSPESVFPGYLRDAVGILYEKQENLRLSLLAGRHCQDRDAEHIEIPIVDIADAANHYEKAQHAGEYDRAARALQAEDYHKRLVVLTALMEQDFGLLRAFAEFDPSVKDMAEKLEAGLLGYTRDPSRSAHKFYSDVSEIGNSTRFNTSFREGERPQALQDTKLADSQTNQPTNKSPNKVTQESKKSALYPQVKDVLNAFFRRQANNQKPSSNTQDNTLEMKNLFSGNLGPLDQENGTIYLPELPPNLDPKVYDKVVPRSALEVELVTTSGQSIKLSRLDSDHRYILGRNEHHPDGIPVVFDVGTVSRRHAMISLHSNQVCISDLGSLAGTYVDGIEIPKGKYVALNDGDTVRLAGVHLTVKIVKR